MVEEQATWKMTGGKPTRIQSLDLKLRKLNLGLLRCKIAVQQAVYGVRKKGQHLKLPNVKNRSRSRILRAGHARIEELNRKISQEEVSSHQDPLSPIAAFPFAANFTQAVGA